MSVRDVEAAVLYKLWKEHYEFVECGKAQVRRGRATTPYRMRAKVNAKIPSHPPAARGLAALQLAFTLISPQNQKPGTSQKTCTGLSLLYYLK